MCFSASASFIAGSALSATGVLTLKKAGKREEIPFAAIPLLFGVQQIFEGLVWLSFSFVNPIWNSVSAHAFLFFAYVLWPIFVPFSLRLLETDNFRKKLLSLFQVVGIGVGAYLSFFLFSHPLIVQAANKSISYFLSIPYGLATVGLYVLVTCGSPLFSSNRIIQIFGVVVSISFAAAYYFYTVTFASVWCFFSAVLSGVIYFFYKNKNGRQRSAVYR